jgi:hypothetical protein
MSLGDVKILRNQNRFKGAPEQDYLIQVPLESQEREIIEGDRNVYLSQTSQFEEERQSSNVFRIGGKIVNIFDNGVSGYTSYTPFGNNLFYINGVEAKTINANQNPAQISAWKGYVQFDEFTFYRTSGISGHIPFYNKSASTYNWNIYVSYPVSGDTEQQMRYENTQFSAVTYFQASDGVPFVLQNTNPDGKSLVTFYCGVSHNLQIGEFVELSISSNGTNYFQVESLGDQYFGSEEKIFSIYNIGYTAFTNNLTGTFKRVLDINNTGETTSQYYVRRHKILTSESDYDLTKLGFENNAFSNKKQLEYSALTPNGVSRVSVKDGSQTCGFTFTKDIDTSELLDNQGRPLSELFVTIMQKGYMGYFNKPYSNGYPGLLIGWDFNFLDGKDDIWWNAASPTNKDLGLSTSSYNFSGKTFYYNNPLEVGDIISGDFCEWNDFVMTETVLSKMMHKFSYNPLIFSNTSPLNYESGYYYQPHFSVPIRAFSTYIEVGAKETVDFIPDWSFYTETERQWRWRDLYPYGYIDTDGVGVDSPFLNDAHYPFSDILFLQVPTSFYRNINRPLVDYIVDPYIDGCE